MIILAGLKLTDSKSEWCLNDFISSLFVVVKSYELLELGIQDGFNRIFHVFTFVKLNHQSIFHRINDLLCSYAWFVAIIVYCWSHSQRNGKTWTNNDWIEFEMSNTITYVFTRTKKCLVFNASTCFVK